MALTFEVNGTQTGGINISRYDGEVPLHNNPIFRRNDATRERFRRDGLTAPFIGGQQVPPELMRVIPTSRYHKITPEMWENMKLMIDTRNLWKHDLAPESAPYFAHQPLYRHHQPRRRINHAVGTVAKPSYPSELTL